MTVSRSRRFRKAFRRYVRSGRNDVLDNLREVIGRLMAYDQQAKDALRERFRDHALKGRMRGSRELHLGQDDLLIYRIHDPGVVELMDITRLRRKPRP